MRKFLILVLLFFISAMPAICADSSYSKQATAFYSDNNFQKTMDMLLQIEENDRTAQDWLLLGNLLDERGEKGQAIFMYQKAIEVEPKYYKGYYNLANLYMEQSRYNMAVDNYKKAVKVKKDNPYLYYNLGCAYLKLGEVKNARRQFIKAVTLKNDIPELQYNLAYVYKSLNNSKVAQIYLDNYNKLTGENF